MNGRAMMPEDHSRVLNPAQLHAVQHGDGPLLVLAGAGSGKTRVITYRIARLIKECGVAPDRIIALTFTNKAANEMRERVGTLLERDARSLWIGTFHATCVRILRRWAHAIDYPRDFLIFDRADQLALIRACMKERNISTDRYPPGAVASEISAYKSNLGNPRPAREAERAGALAAKAAAIYPLYQERLVENGAMDFDDLLANTVRLFQTDTRALETYHKRWSYILVDEYQDTNYPQYRLLQLLSARHQNLFVVGDDDQSIYRWRGAQVENILEFERDFPETGVITLEENYRSTRMILEAAGHLIRRNLGRKEKELFTRREVGEPICYFRAADEIGEGEFIVRTIQELADGEMRRYGDCAVFYRTNEQSRAIEDALRRTGVPYVVVGATRFYERREVKDVLAYLRAGLNLEDSLALKRIINVPPRGIGRVTVSDVERLAGEQGCSFHRALIALVETDGVSNSTKSRVRSFLDLLDQLREAALSLPLAEAVGEVICRSGYKAFLEREAGREAAERVGSALELASAAAEYAERADEPTMRRFLDHCALVTRHDEADGGQGAVTLMTLHMSKGLEFPVVFIAGMENGLFPHARSLGSFAELEEERRLCYVGMTRGGDRLFLTNASSRRLFGVVRHNPPSMFLSNLPREYLVEKVGPQPRTGAAPSGDGPGRPAARESESVPFPEGCWVNHDEWGPGVVTRREGEGDGLKITVLFQALGEKKLMVKYAPLRPA